MRKWLLGRNILPHYFICALNFVDVSLLFSRQLKPVCKICKTITWPEKWFIPTYFSFKSFTNLSILKLHNLTGSGNFSLNRTNRSPLSIRVRNCICMNVGTNEPKNLEKETVSLKRKHFLKRKQHLKSCFWSLM